jgi:hypothetical protein
MTVIYDLSQYVDIARVVNDSEYASEKHLTVKEQNAVENSTSDKLYLLQYIKNKLNDTNHHTLGQFRSVITDGKKILSFAPPKSIGFDKFKSFCGHDEAAILEFCEGTMINLFYNSIRGDWELATRGNIGARCKFYQHAPKTFRAMFLEAMIRLYLKFAHLDQTKSYSFVLQHRDNRIVVPFRTKDLVLTNIYSFDGFNVQQEDATYVKEEAERLNCGYPHQFSAVINATHTSYDALVEHFNTMKEDYQIVGAMFIDPRTGFRTKLRNPTYEYVRHLKGNSPKLQFQYYNLRKLGKVREYLHYYPEMKVPFAEFRRSLHQWTNSLLAHYTQCYIKREAPLKEFPYAFRPHMFQLHQIYLNRLRPARSYVSHKVVIDYVNNLESPRLMFAINYNYNKNEIKCQANDIHTMLKHAQ